MTVREDTPPTDVVPPSRRDPVAAGASRLFGGPRGRHATGGGSRWWTPVRAVLVLTVLTSVLGFLAKAPCRTHPWTDEYQYTRACYTDVYALYFAESLGNGPGGHGRISVPYRDHPVEYPAVIGGLMWTAAEVTNLVHPHDPRSTPAGVVDERGRTFFDITALLLAAFALLTTWAVARLAGRPRVWDAAMVALAPTLLFHAYTNWDLAAVGLATLALWAWTRTSWPHRLGPAVSGLLLGVAVATKLYPLLILLAILALCWRARQLVPGLVALAGTVVGFVLAYLPAWLLTNSFRFPDATCPGGHPLSAWRWFWSLNQTRGADWDSLWFQLEHARGSPLDQVRCGQAPFWLNTWVALATLAVVAAVLVLVLAAPRRPRLPQVAFLLVAGFLLVNKVDSPQYVLWLVPLAVLARPRWPAFLAWQAAEVALLFARFYFFVGNDRPNEGVPIGVFFATVWVRDIALVVLMVLVVREILRPHRDVVRADGADDPAGGVLDGAPDRWEADPPRMPAPAPA